MNKNLVTYSLISLIIIPIFGFNFFISFFGNILLLILLIPILILLIALISFNSLKSRLKICNKCGKVSLGVNEICTNCGVDLDDINKQKFKETDKPSQTIIEVKAEEIN